MRIATAALLAIGAFGCWSARPDPAIPASQPVAHDATRSILPARQPHHAEIVAIQLSVDGTSALTRDAFGEVRLWPSLDGSKEPVKVSGGDIVHATMVALDDGWEVSTIDRLHQARLQRFDVHATATGARAIAGEWKQIHLLSPTRALGIRTDDVVHVVSPDGSTPASELPGLLVDAHLTARGQLVTLTGAFVPSEDSDDHDYSCCGYGKFEGFFARISLKDGAAVVSPPVPVETDYALSGDLFAASPDGWTVAYSRSMGTDEQLATFGPPELEPTYPIWLMNLRDGTHAQVSSGRDASGRSGHAQPEVTFVDEATLLMSFHGKEFYKEFLDLRTGSQLSVPSAFVRAELGAEHAMLPRFSGVRHDRFANDTWAGSVGNRLAVSRNRSTILFLGYSEFRPTTAAISPSSEWVAWCADVQDENGIIMSKIVVDSLASSSTGVVVEASKLPGIGQVDALAFDGTDKLLIVGGSHLVRWDWRTGKPLASQAIPREGALRRAWEKHYPGEFDPVTGLWAFVAPGSAFVLRIADGPRPFVTSRLVKADSWVVDFVLRRSPTDPGGGVWAVAPTGEVATRRFDELNAGTANEITLPAGSSTRPPGAIAMSRDGTRFHDDGARIVRTSPDGDVQVWPHAVRNTGALRPSPDGKAVIALPSCAEPPRFVVVDFSADPPTHWSASLFYFGDLVVWSPDSRYIAAPAEPLTLDICRTAQDHPCGYWSKHRGETARVFEASTGKIVYRRDHLGFLARRTLERTTTMAVYDACDETRVECGECEVEAEE